MVKEKIKSVKIPNEWEKAEKGYKVSVPYNKALGILRSIPNCVSSIEVGKSSITLHSDIIPNLKGNESLFLLFANR